MAVRIIALDWHSTDARITTQEGTINTFLSNNTVTSIDTIAAVSEYIIVQYTAVIPVSIWKVKIFKAVESIMQNGVSATETAINNFLSGKTIVRIINLDSGTILLVYI